MICDINMVVNQFKSKKSASGARYNTFRKKKLMHKGNKPIETKLGSEETKKIRAKGGSLKIKKANAEFANVIDPKTKKSFKVKIESVIKNPANRHYVRRNIITKGAFIKTEKGEARVTSRPGQDGVVNAVLV